jgi:chromosome partitioning protein
MKVVALSSRKGGAGKSTIAVHLAVAAEAAGLATAIFDLDPQASAALWSDHRGESSPAVVPAQAPRLRALLKQAVDGGADLVLLDTPPHADGVSADAGALSDAILIPCRPSAFDLDAIGASVRLAQASNRPCWVVINAAPVQGLEVSETQAALKSAGVDVVPVVIHQRKAFSARAHEGRTAGEIEPGSKAAAEIEALLSWLRGAVELPPDLGAATGRPATTVQRKTGGEVTGYPATTWPANSAPLVAKELGPVVTKSQVPGGPDAHAPLVSGKPGSRRARV